MMPSRLALLLTCALVPVPAEVAANVALPRALTSVADKVVVLKSQRKLMLMSAEQTLRTYRISLGANPVGAKFRRGDHKTPEGLYTLNRRNARSQYYRSIHISYPNADDRARARKLGVSPGGDIFLHGWPNGYKPSAETEDLGDWTDGCIAVSDPEMDEIWQAVPNGTPIEIRP
jgi:murein L,D-transpeptidase YafK